MDWSGAMQVLNVLTTELLCDDLGALVGNFTDCVARRTEQEEQTARTWLLSMKTAAHSHYLPTTTNPIPKLAHWRIKNPKRICCRCRSTTKRRVTMCMVRETPINLRDFGLVLPEVGMLEAVVCLAIH